MAYSVLCLIIFFQSTVDCVETYTRYTSHGFSDALEWLPISV